MTKVTGYLEGPEGALNGRLFVKAGGAFIGAPTSDLIFRITDGVVDVELPPCPVGLPYYVDWRAIGDTRKVTYIERWRVPAREEVSLDEVRGLVRQTAAPVRAEAKSDLLETTMLRSELQEALSRVASMEKENDQLRARAIQAESNAVAAQGKVASLSAELRLSQRKVVQSKKPVVIEKERIIEKKVHDITQAEDIARHVEKIEMLRQQNEKLEKELADTVVLSTHFANLHAEIDRLNVEKQQLLLRIDALKAPVRYSSALRSEAIANLDKLTDG